MHPAARLLPPVTVLLLAACAPAEQAPGPEGGCPPGALPTVAPGTSTVGTTGLAAITEQIAPTTPPAVFNTNDDAKLALVNGQVDAIVVDLPAAFSITGAELRAAGTLAALEKQRLSTTGSAPELR